MLKKAMIYLGLGPDEHYESYDDPIRVQQAQSPRQPPNVTAGQYPSGVGVVPGSSMPVDAAPLSDDASVGRTVRPVNLVPALDDAGRSDFGDQDVRLVQSIPTRAPAHPMKPHAVTPAAFNDAQEIGDRFKSGQPVIVNLQALDRDLRRRLVDFASGLCYAIGGKMDRVADQVYLLTPDDADASRGGRRRRH
ncbi:MAG: cell division protein SepF [Acidimicrobiaceae bacterium]|nr:cell division protein SepF [Acidimicrobiaceae bacterium]